MSVAEVFLRGGRPCTTTTEFTSTYATCYAHWRWVVYAPRQWCHDATTNCVSCPVFYLLFGLAETVKVDTKRQDWHLLYVDMHKDITKAVRGGDAASLMCCVLQGLAKGLQPRTLHVIGVVNGSTHDKLGLFSHSDWQALCARLRERCATSLPDLHFAHSFVQDGLCASMEDVNGKADSEDDDEDVMCASLAAITEPWLAMLRQAVMWLQGQSGLVGTRDASIAPQTHNEPLLALLPHLNPLLWSSLYVRPDKAKRESGCNAKADYDDEGKSADIELLTGTAKLRAMRDAARQTWRRQTGEYAAFALPLPGVDGVKRTSDGAVGTLDETNTLPFPFAFLLQRPLQAKRPVDLDNRDPGPLSPQPIAAELHLLPDRGDVLYLVRQMSNTATIQFVYDDYLHEEGELFVQLGPVEGVGFDDLDRMLNAITATREKESAMSEDAAEKQARRGVVCPGSCSPYVFPRVLRRVPTGTTHKPNPLAHARASVVESEATPVMMQNAALALRFLSDQLVPIVENKNTSETASGGPRPGYTLPWGDNNEDSMAAAAGIAPFADPQRRCIWCDRQREKLQRCGGCRAVLYCCKAHQALDWKEGSHKADCRAWRTARELAETQVEPFLTRLRLSTTTAVVRTVGWSYGACIAQFILGIAADLPRVMPRCIHVIGVHGAYLAALLDTLATYTSALQATLRNDDNSDEETACGPLRLLFSSDTFTEAQRNEVWAVGPDARVWQLPSMGVLGDAWHLAALAAPPKAQRDSSHTEAPPLLLVRLSNTKYYLYDQGSQQDGSRPQALLSFGPPHSNAGLSYFDASVELVVRDLLGRVPTRWIESSYIAALRTYKTLVTRVTQCDACSAALRAAMTRTTSSDSASKTSTTVPIVFNEDGVAVFDETKEEEEDKVEQGSERQRESNGLFVYTNGFYFDIAPV